MIGIQQLDNLTTEQMLDVINGKIKVLVRDPNYIRTVVLDPPPRPSVEMEGFLKHDTVITLLKMELETRLAFEKILEHIRDEAKKCGCDKCMELLE